MGTGTFPILVSCLLQARLLRSAVQITWNTCATKADQAEAASALWPKHCPIQHANVQARKAHAPLN